MWSLQRAFARTVGAFQFTFTNADRIGSTYLIRDDLPCKTARVVVYHFPATDPIAASDRVEFTARVGPQIVTRTFEMSQMVVNGNLDIR